MKRMFLATVLSLACAFAAAQADDAVTEPLRVTGIPDGEPDLTLTREQFAAWRKALGTCGDPYGESCRQAFRKILGHEQRAVFDANVVRLQGRSSHR